MKRIVFLTFVAAAMVSCTNDEVIELSQEAIAFSDVFVNNTTRAIDNSFSTTNKPGTFYVYGTTQGDEAGAPLVTIFNFVEVKNKVDNNGFGDDYNYDVNYTQYWIDGNKYNFAALVNAEQTNVTIGSDCLPSTLAFVSNSETDLLYAKSSEITGKVSDNETIGFNFEHLLSKVYITFKNTILTNTENNKYEYKVTDVKIVNAVSSAECDLSSKKWSKHSDSNTIEVKFGNITDKTDSSESTDAISVYGIGEEKSATSHYARLLIPGNYGVETDNKVKDAQPMDISFVVETLINGQTVDKRQHKALAKVELVAGQAYNFIISKGAPGEQIKFTVSTVQEWDNRNVNM